jgi:Rps23 Pro-64 3,4-dihydroxylase Tpa1-like proline 4-hydroxylase
MVHEVPELRALDERLTRPEVIRYLAELTGLPLTQKSNPSTLTLWGPGTFVAEHGDLGPKHAPNRLAISLSLCERWLPEWGGETLFTRHAEGKRARVWPELNRAVLFTPDPAFVHEVTRVSPRAPAGVRFTFTMFFR